MTDPQQTEESMVEKVARAICKAMGENPDCVTERFLPGSCQTDEGEPHWKGYVEHARAALEAVREPTQEMLNARGKNDMGYEASVSGYLDNWSAETVWQAMISEALK